MNKRRKLIIALGASAFTAPFESSAQPQGKVWRIGYLDFGSRQSLIDAGRYAALMEGLREHGYVEGKSLVLEARYAEGKSDRLNGLATELVQQKVDVIVSTGTPASRAAQRATTTIPIVITATTDPVGDGLAISLARPGKNITGMSSGAEDTVLKLLELLLVAAPKLTRIAVIGIPENSTHAKQQSRLQAAAKEAGRQAVPVSVRTPADIERAFAAMKGQRVDAVIILIDTFLFSQRAQIAALALKHRLPSIYPVAAYAEAGGLMSYGVDTNDNFRRAAIFVNKIFKGTKPGDIPFEQPTRYYFAINRKTANALGVKISGELLTRADKVIE